MKRLSLLLMLVMAVMVGCKDNSKFVLKGTITNAVQGSMVYLYGFSATEALALDSTYLSDKGEFIFERSASDSELYRLVLDMNAYTFVAENGDQITLTADANSFDGAYTLEGSKEAENVNKLNALLNKHKAIVSKIEEDFEEKVNANPDARQALLNEITPIYNKALYNESRELIQFGVDHPESLIGFYAVNIAKPMNNELLIVEYANKIEDKFEGNVLVDSFKVRMQTFKTVQIGQVAPDFTTYTPDGAKVSLADFKGKYTLIEFWASWCEPCRAENPHIVAAYNKYKDKNFTVFGISIDKDKEAWQNAIKQDGLVWTNGGDGFGFEGPIAKLYMLESTPTSYLLDPQGKIIAKNLRGPELEAFLAKTL